MGTRQIRAGGSWRGLFGGCLVVFGLSCLGFAVNAQLIRNAPAWHTFEFCQYAEIGRNLAVDGTFGTRLVEPMALATIDRDDRARSPAIWPVVSRYPLPCLAVAGWMKILGPTDLAAAWSNGLAIALLGATTYAAARIWFGAGWAALVAVLFLANPSFFGDFILIGTPDVWFATVFLLELLVWSRFDPGEPQPRLAWAATVGVLGGLSYLCRFNALAFLVLQAAVLARQRHWRELGLMSLTALVVASPMLVYNSVHFRRPFVSIYSAWNLLDRIGAAEVEPWLYYRIPDLTSELWTHRLGVARKFFTNLFVVVPSGIWSLWRLELLIPVALIAPWTSGRGTSLRRFAIASVGLFAVQLVLFSGLRLEFEGRDSPHNGRYFFWFAAPALLLAVGTLSRLGAGRWWRRGLVSLVILAQVGLFIAAWIPIIRRQNQDSGGPRREPVLLMLAEVVQENRVLASNQPQITAWYGGLRSISFPADIDELERINRDSPTPIDYLCIDMSMNAIELDDRWIRILAHHPRFPSPWEARLMSDYEYVLPPERTRPIGYIFLRRKGVPPSNLERRQNP